MNTKKFCVVCGDCDESNLTRHHIVPYCYIKHFPHNLKNQDFYNVVLLCKECHQNYEKKATVLKKQIFKRYKIKCNDRLQIVKNAANALMTHPARIPEVRKKQLRKVVGNYLGKKQITLSDVSHAMRLTCKDNPYEQVLNHIDMFKLTKMWRKHFIRNAKPKHISYRQIVNRDMRRHKFKKLVEILEEQDGLVL